MIAQYLSIPDELGRQRSLATGVDAYERLLPAAAVNSAGTLLLGAGPFPDELAAAAALSAPVYYVECPDFERALVQQRVPEDWIRIEPSAAAELAVHCVVWQYRQNIRLFSSFWGPILARVMTARLGPLKDASSSLVLLPGDDASLLTQELEASLTELGFRPLRLPEKDVLAQVSRLLREERPLCLISVNGRGLDADGLLFRLLQSLDIPTAVWMVDNVWHVLGGWRQPWWKAAHLFVTDASFVEPLRACGAQRVCHLPLGAWMPPPERAYAGSPIREIAFVGRSAFPDKAKFFSGLRCDPELLAEARVEARPDFSWWLSRVKFKELWPGKDARMAGLGAETCSQQRRADWLRVAADRLTVFGDTGWRALLDSSADIRPPVDYYTDLAAIYAASRYSLNITSLLLPAGLTQRHFDVWTSGGFLLTDATPGLRIFPSELVRPVCLEKAGDLLPAVERLGRDPLLRQHLAEAWRTCLTREHRLSHRLIAMLGQMKLP